MANGKVFLPNHDNAVRVYGLLAPTPTPGRLPAAFADTYVESGSPEVNFGRASELRSKLSSSSAEFTRIAYIKFDLSTATSVGRAVLRLTGRLSNTANTNVKVNVSAVTNTSWDEATLTWNIKPALGSLLGTITVPGTTAQTFDLDITSRVQAEKQAGHQFVVVGLSNPTATSPYATFGSRETGGTGPQLLITPATSNTNADAYVQGGTTASTNFGNSTELRVKAGQSGDTTRQSFLRFDVGTAPNVGRATLRVFGALSNANSSNVIANLFAVDDTSWSETAITWNTRPALGAALGRITVPDTTPRWFEVDVTNYMRAQAAAGRRLVSFAFTAPTVTTAYITLNSLQAATNKPQLVIEAPRSSTGADAYVRGGTYATANFGSEPELLVKLSSSATATRESYLKFDVPATVTSAVLRLFGHLASTDEPAVVTTVFGVADTSWQPATITWNTRPTGGLSLGTVRVVGTTPAWVELDVTSYVQREAAAGRRAVTLALRNLNATATWTAFSASDAGTNQPQLVIR